MAIQEASAPRLEMIEKKPVVRARDVGEERREWRSSTRSAHEIGPIARMKDEGRINDVFSKKGTGDEEKDHDRRNVALCSRTVDRIICWLRERKTSHRLTEAGSPSSAGARTRATVDVRCWS